jgi:hypothetical protein
MPLRHPSVVRQRPHGTQSDGGVPSTPLQPGAAAHSKAQSLRPCPPLAYATVPAAGPRRPDRGLGTERRRGGAQAEALSN